MEAKQVSELLQDICNRLDKFDERMNRLEIKGDKMFTLAKGMADKI